MPAQVTVIAGVDIGNATTEVAVLAGGRLLGADRLPTRGRKGSAESLRGAAALVRRPERRLGWPVDRGQHRARCGAVDTGTADRPGRCRRAPAGCGCWPPAWPPRAARGSCVGRPVAGSDARTRRAGPPGGRARLRSRWSRPGSATRQAAEPAAAACWRPGVPVGAVLAAGDEGVLIANRLDAPVPVLDQVDIAAAGGLLAARGRGPPARPAAHPAHRPGGAGRGARARRRRGRPTRSR